jgi:hypothetical protein
MGLIECPDCDGKVSDIAPACPHCGRPFESQIRKLSGRPRRERPRQSVNSDEREVDNSAQERVFGVIWAFFRLIWHWLQLQAKILTFIIFAVPFSFFCYLLVLLLPLGMERILGWPSEKALINREELIWIPAVIMGTGLSGYLIFVKKIKWFK